MLIATLKQRVSYCLRDDIIMVYIRGNGFLQRVNIRVWIDISLSLNPAILQPTVISN